MKPEGLADPNGEFEQRFLRIEGLLAQLSASTDPLVERATREVLATVLELHQRGLARMLEITAADAQVREALSRDPRVSAMLLLHGLHPLALDTRVSRAIDNLRQRFHEKLTGVTVNAHAGAITVRVVPAASACSGTRATLRKDFEDALLAAAPDADSILVEFADPEPALITLRLQREPRSEHTQGSQR
jgi:hypothetical protein